MSLEHSVKTLIRYIRRQENQWGAVSTPWGTLLVLPEHQLNPILREVERWLEITDEGKASRIDVYAQAPTMVAAAPKPEPHTKPPTPVTATGSLGGRGGISA
jgi:hypothetical protein